MAMSPWAVEHEAGWELVLAELRAAGWQVEMTCFAAPVQLEGLLPDGEPFYFRARHGDVLFAVGGEDPADIAECEHEEPHRDASYLPAVDGAEALRRLVDEHRREHGVANVAVG
jgi:hypothetical protein